METIEVTPRQFIGNYKIIFKQADAGTQIVIKRGKGRSYALTPTADDFVVTPELLAKIERAEQQYREGKVTVCKTVEEAITHLESLNLISTPCSA